MRSSAQPTRLYYPQVDGITSRRYLNPSDNIEVSIGTQFQQWLKIHKNQRTMLARALNRKIEVIGERRWGIQNDLVLRTCASKRFLMTFGILLNCTKITKNHLSSRGGDLSVGIKWFAGSNRHQAYTRATYQENGINRPHWSWTIIFSWRVVLERLELGLHLKA